ncbi:MAG: sugar ABC transporter permease [Caldilineaceae bacterium SB0668_bin_21]|nr:sugar ABC transporter permease [Caldilineaceae bacterium SB0668_bin_21]MYC23121.1 sugar ABC transporter permease [Caldilineaceae bacterium SB0662_bin_25]
MTSQPQTAVAPAGKASFFGWWRWRRIEGYLFIAPWLIGFVAFVLGPFLASFFLSFADWNLVRPPTWVGLEHYRTMLTNDPKYIKSFVNTVYFTVFHVPLILVVALFVALLLNRQLPGIGVFRTLFYLPSVTAGVATAILWRFIFNYHYGLLNQAIGLLGIQGPNWLGSTKWAMPAFIIMSTWGFGSLMVLYLAGLQGVPRELYEAAEIDGATAWDKLLNVTIPMMSPVIFFTMIMTIIGSFQIFTAAFVMTEGGPADATLFYILYLYRSAFQWLRIGYASAMAWILFLVILALTLIQLKLSRRWVFYAGEDLA